MSVPNEHIAVGNGLALPNPKCSTFWGFAPPEMISSGNRDHA